MKVVKKDSDSHSGEHAAIFRQGADCVVSGSGHSAALWHSNVPVVAGEKLGTIGACDLVEGKGADLFLKECAEFLRAEHGCTKVIGPMNGNTWLEHRLVIESDGSTPFLMEPSLPAFYHKEFLYAGFSELSTYCSNRVDIRQDQPEHDWLLAKFQSRGLTFRSVSINDFEQDLLAIFDLSLASFANNYLYTPISRDAFIAKYNQAKSLIDPELVIMAELDDELVGYLFCLPDPASLGGEFDASFILKTLAVKLERKFAGLGSLLVGLAHEVAIRKGYSYAIHALQHENNAATRISARYSAKKFRRYALMEKCFS